MPVVSQDRNGSDQVIPFTVSEPIFPNLEWGAEPGRGTALAKKDEKN
jgi:hypothetical protein